MQDEENKDSHKGSENFHKDMFELIMLKTIIINDT